MGILIIDRRTGSILLNSNLNLDLISIIPLATQKTFIANSEHLDDVISVFVNLKTSFKMQMASQPFTGDNNQMNSYSKCFLQAMSKDQLLFSTNVCFNHKKKVLNECTVEPPMLFHS